MKPLSGFLRKYWLGLVALALAIAAMVLPLIIPMKSIARWNDILENMVVLLGWGLFLVQYLYHKSESFYIWVTSWRLWITNETINWSFSIEFGGCAKSDPIHQIWRIIRTHNKKATRWHHNGVSLIANMPGYTVRASVHANGEVLDNSQMVSIQMSDLELPFRTFRARIENEIVPLLKDISGTFKPRTEKYAAKISFSSSNPYFGFFVRRLDLPKIVSFSCDLLENSVGNYDQVVTVRKDRIDIVTDDLFALQVLSIKYVALSSS